jgi:hypothetical protein
MNFAKVCLTSDKSHQLTAPHNEIPFTIKEMTVGPVPLITKLTNVQQHNISQKLEN